MSGNAALAEATPSAPETVPDGEVMTAAERAYFQSRGEEVEGLAPNETVPPQRVAPMPKANGTDDGTENQRHGTELEEVDGELEIGDDGTPRDLKTGRFVPKSAYLRVKERQKDTDAKVAALTEYAIRARERLAMFQELAANDGRAANETVPEARVAPPSPEEDIFGFAKWQQQQIEDLRAQLAATSSETREAIQQREIRDAATRDMHTFYAKEPAFLDGYKFLVDGRHAELEALGIADHNIREARIREEAKAIIDDALRNGRSGAETIYRLARARGFNPPPAQAAPTIDPAAVEGIERINRGQQAAVSMRASGGVGSAGDVLTAEKLLAMPDGKYSETRQAYIAKYGRGAWEKLLGK